MIKPAKEKGFAYLYNMKKPMKTRYIVEAVVECRSMGITF